MRIRAKLLALGIVLVCLGAVSAYAQEKSDASNTAASSTPSLGDLARKVKADKAKEPKPAKVFTNDNLPAPKPGEPQVSSSSPEKSTAEAAPAGGPTQAHDEKYYRKQMSLLQAQLDTDQRELAVLQQKLGQNDMQFYSNPQQSLMQQYTRGDINKLTADVDAKKKKIADDQKAIDDLRDQLHQEGGDPGWLR